MPQVVDRPSELSALHAAIAAMELPDHKKKPVTNDSLRWLARNLRARNAAHGRFADACARLATLGHPADGALA